MRRSGTVALVGIGLFLVGLALLVYTTVFQVPYSGASGAGMAGLPAAMLVLASLALLAAGGLTALLAGAVYLFRRRR